MKIATPLALVAWLGAAQAASGQSPSPSPPPLRIEVDVGVVSLTAVVQDKSGRFVHGLTARDVEIYEDGVRQEVSYFREASGDRETRVPLSVILVLDANEPPTPVDQLRDLLIRLSEHWEAYRIFDWQPDVPWTNNATEQVIGRMKVRSRTVRGYKTRSGLLAGLLAAVSGVR